MELNSRQNKVYGETGHKKRINQNATINVECLLYTQKCSLVATTGQSDTSSGTHKAICRVPVPRRQVGV